MAFSGNSGVINPFCSLAFHVSLRQIIRGVILGEGWPGQGAHREDAPE